MIQNAQGRRERGAVRGTDGEGAQLGDGGASRLHGEVNLLLGFSIYIVCNIYIHRAIKHFLYDLLGSQMNPLFLFTVLSLFGETAITMRRLFQ